MRLSLFATAFSRWALAAMFICFVASSMPALAHEQQNQWIVQNNTDIKKLRDELERMMWKIDAKERKKNFREDINQVNESKIVALSNQLEILRIDVDAMQREIKRAITNVDYRAPNNETKMDDITGSIEKLAHSMALMNIKVESMQISIEFLQQYNERQKKRQQTR